MNQEPRKATTRTEQGDCPSCGCNASVVVNRYVRWGAPKAERQCDHCGHAWETDDQPAKAAAIPAKHPAAGEQPTYSRTRCPKCGSASVAVKRTMKARNGWRRRYHKCGGCGESFHTDEKS